MTPAALLSPRQVAVILGVHPQTVSKWARQGYIHCVLTPGGHRRFRPSDVDEFLSTSAAKATLS